MPVSFPMWTWPVKEGYKPDLVEWKSEMKSRESIQFLVRESPREDADPGSAQHVTPLLAPFLKVLV